MTPAPAPAVPVFVDRATAAFNMSVSVDTFDAIRNRRVGFPAPAYHEGGRPFWRWVDIENHLAPGIGEAQFSDPSPFQRALTSCERQSR